MQQNDDQYEKMIKTPIPKLILTLAVPTMIGMLITSAYNMADAYFVSKLGTSASGAIGIVFSLMAIIQALGFTVGMGSGSTISRLLGKKENDKAQEMASSALAVSFILGIILSVTGLLMLEKMMMLLGATKSILPYAVEYAKYILYAAPVMMASFVLNNLLRAEGKTKLAMTGIGIGGILNIALDPLLIFGFGMDIGGAAVATLISQVIGFIVLLSFFRKKTILRFSIRKISKKFTIYKEFIGNGMPSLFRQGLASVASVALNRVAAAQSDAAVAAMSIVGKIFMMVFCVLIGFGQGYQPAAGYNYGAKEYGRVKKAYRFMLWAGTGVMTVLGILLYAAAPWLLEQFVSDDPKVMEIGVRALRMQCAVMPFMPLGVACNMTFQAVGRSAMASFLAACRQGVFFLPLIWVLPKFYGIVGMEIAQPAADAATFLVCLPVIRHFLKGLKTEK
mgnify:FL=1